jgi:hypothetical protein
MEKLIEPKSNPKLLPNEVRNSTQQMQPCSLIASLDLGPIWVRFEFQCGCGGKYRIIPLDIGITYVTIIYGRCA